MTYTGAKKVYLYFFFCRLSVALVVDSAIFAAYLVVLGIVYCVGRLRCLCNLFLVIILNFILLHLVSIDTIISWTDPEVATDLALSFQETMGCSFIW
jgi:hypothetical protein